MHCCDVFIYTNLRCSSKYSSFQDTTTYYPIRGACCARTMCRVTRRVRPLPERGHDATYEEYQHTRVRAIPY